MSDVFIRRYTLFAIIGQEASLEAALKHLASIVRSLPGSLGVELFKASVEPGKFVFEERWVSQKAHGDAAPLLPRGAMAPVMAALDGEPDILELSGLDLA